MAVLIPIVAEFAGKGVQKAIKEFQSLQGVTDKAAFILKKGVVPAAVAVSGATVTLGTVLFKAAQAAAEDERSQAALAKQLQNTTNATDTQIAANERFVSALSMASGVADDKLRPALANLVRYTGQLDDAQQQLRLALDISAATGQDLEAVTTALGKAYNGNVTALSKLGVPLDENAKKTKDYATLQKQLNDQFGGASAAAANTYEGQLAKLRIGLNDVQEGIGRAVLPLLEKFVNYINRAIVPALQVFIDGLTGGKGVKQAFIDGLGAADNFGATIIDGMEKAALAVLIFANKLALAYEFMSAIVAVVQFLRGNVPAAITAAGKTLAAYAAVVATDKAFKSTKSAFDDLRAAVDASVYSQRTATATAYATGDAFDRLGYQVINLKKEIEDDDEKKKKNSAATEALKKRQQELAQKTKELADVLEKQMSNALDVAKKRLEDAQAAFDDFYQSTRDAALGALDLDAAFTNAGDNVASGFIDELQEQADRTTLFSNKVRQLLDAGLSASALKRVIAAGVDRGTEIADAILGGAQSVLKINALVDTIEKLAEDLGMTTAAKFYQAGIDSAKAYLEGVDAAISGASAVLKGAKTPADVKGAEALFGRSMATVGRGFIAPPTYNEYVIYAQSLEPALAGQSIVDALKQFERRNGAIDITVASAFGLVD